MSNFLQTKTILISVLSLTWWIYPNDSTASFYFPETLFRTSLTLNVYTILISTRGCMTFRWSCPVGQCILILIWKLSTGVYIIIETSRQLVKLEFWSPNIMKSKIHILKLNLKLRSTVAISISLKLLCPREAIPDTLLYHF